MNLGRPSSFKDEFCQIALDVLKKGGSIVQVCAELEISRETFYDWNNPESPRFKDIFSDTIKLGLMLSQSWWEKQGQISTFNSEGFNATSYIFTMKNRFREDYSDTIKQEITNTSPLVITFDNDSVNDKANGSV